MKLRNKKTGEVVEVSNIGLVWNRHGMPADIGSYGSLAELNANWEDHKPSEPLIKDEKVRKAVRAWAEACDVERCHYDGDGDFATRWHGIKLDGSGEQLEEGNYTIDELCGEEEE